MLLQIRTNAQKPTSSVAAVGVAAAGGIYTSEELSYERLVAAVVASPLLAANHPSATAEAAA